MGAVGASTHGFWQISSHFHQVFIQIMWEIFQI